MASYNVKITFDPRKVATADVAPHANICNIFEPKNSYVETEGYAGTRYNANVKGFGDITQDDSYANTHIPMSVPLAQFNLATQAQVVDEETGVRELTFVVDDYKEAFYYNQLGKDMADQGFTVKVEGLGVDSDDKSDDAEEGPSEDTEGG